MSKTYFGCGKKRNIGSFPVILAFIGLFLISNLGADCTDLGGGHINCNETVNSDIYNNMSNGVSSSSILSVNVENMHGMHNNNNGTWGFNEVNINVGGGTGGYGIYAQGANINIGNNADITTNGTGSYGVYAMSGSSITIGDNASISTHGYTFPSQSLSHGVYASSNSNITIGDNLNILTTGVGSAGIYTYGSTGIENIHVVIGDNAKIITTGGDPICGRCGLSPTTGWYSYGVYLITKNSDLTIGNNAFISTQGANAYAVTAGNTNAYVYIGNNATIATYGNNASAAVYAYNGGKVIVGDNVNISTIGNATLSGSNMGNNPVHAVWVQSAGSEFYAGDNAVISTYGYDASGISATSYANVVLGDNARITTYGEGKYTGANEGGFGIKIRGSYANLTVGDNAVITTHGNQALGVQIRETSQGIFGDNLTIITHGNTAAALENYDRSNVTIGNNALIATLGNNSHAVHTLPYTAAGEANTVIGSGSVISTQGDGSHALFVEGKSVTVGARIILNTDTNISALGVGSYAVYSNNTNGLVFTNSSAKLNIFGDIAAQNGGNVDLGLSNGSYLYGNTNSETGVISLAFDGSGSLWKLKGSSSLTNLSLTNNAKVDLTQSASYATLSIDNLKGSGIFHQRINPIGNGDLIVINNSSSGNHKLTFDDSALGGYIVEGNESFIVVQQNQSGTHNANFSGEAYIGAYTYYVVHVNNTQYLAADASVIGGNGSGGGGVPVLNSAALSSVSFANINYISNYANTQTLLQRLGELGLNRDTLDDIWVRAYAGKLDSFDAKFEVQDADYYGLQAGFDRVYDMNNGRLFAGFTFGLSKTNIDYKLGDGSVDSYDIGLYASYKNDNNFYADTLLKYTRNKNEFDIITPNSVEITASSSANAYSLSFEGGKRFSIGGGFYIEPQAEFTFSRQPAGTSVASSGLKTKFDSYNSILGRAGAVAGYSLKDETNIYYKTGYIKEFDGDVSYSFNDESAKQTYKLNGSIFDNAIGVVSTINKVHHLYFEGTYQVGNSFDNKKANFGYKYSF